MSLLLVAIVSLLLVETPFVPSNFLLLVGGQEPLVASWLLEANEEQPSRAIEVKNHPPMRL